MTTLNQLADLVGGKAIGQSDLPISGVSELNDGKPGTISFLGNQKYRKFLNSTKASAVIVSSAELLEGRNGIEVQNPQLAFSKILKIFNPELLKQKGIHPTAVIDPTAHIDEDVCIGPYAVIEANSKIGKGTIVGASSVISLNSVIGKECRIHARVTLYHDSLIGDRVVIFSGSVIGSDGFGFVTDKDTHHKIPQVGKVIIGSDVEIGANCVIDRATIGTTRIGNMTKLDNLVHIAHNVKIGIGCLFAAGVGIAGTVTIKDFCIFAGQSGVVPHVTIGSKAIIAAQSGVTKSLEGGELYSGMPARKIREQHRKNAVLQSLSALKKRVDKLENLVLKNEHNT